MLDLERYQKHLLLPEIGWEGQQKLRRAAVLVVGAGGLGCPVLQYLAAAGVGTLGVADHDTVSLSNLQRQVLYATATVGRPKVDVAKEVLQALNPGVTVRPYAEKLTAENASQLLADYDFAVDCTDNLKARYVLNDACVAAGKPFVYGSIHRFEGQVAVFNHEDGPTYRCLFEEGEAEPPNCADVGVLGVLAGIVGAYQALEAVKLITGIGELLSGKLLMLNTLTNTQRVIKIKRRAILVTPNGIRSNSEQHSELQKPLSSALTQWLHNPDAVFLDVRESASKDDLFPIDRTRHIPLSQLAGYIDELPRDKALVVFCQSGRMSGVAVQILMQQYGFVNVENLEGGLNGLMKASNEN